jgi:glycosyltransferase involved in cell wall biosynthesis
MITKPLISIVLGSYNRLRFLKLTIDSIRNELAETPHEIIVIDGGSADGTLSWLMKQKDILSIIQHNRGEWKGRKIKRRSWGYFMNLGFKAAQGKFICMLSDDCLLVPGAVRNGISKFEKELSDGENIGALAFYWRDWPNQKKYRVGLTLGEKMFVNHGMYLKKALEDVNFIDEETYGFYHADGDLCLKMWEKGYECTDSPDSFVEHYSHANLNVRATNLANQQKDWGRYLQKWSGIYFDPLQNNFDGWIEKEFEDPFYTWKIFKKETSRFFGIIRLSNKVSIKVRRMLDSARRRSRRLLNGRNKSA